VVAFYEKAGSLFVEAYDAFYSGSAPQIAGDVAFYERLACEVGPFSKSPAAPGALPWRSPKRGWTSRVSTSQTGC
jgi:hypothetical protein